MTAATSTKPSDEVIIEFLRDNPDFLTRHPDLLEFLSLPARNEGENVN
jgi:uncharacterized protein YigA (DUF484 family)